MTSHSVRRPQLSAVHLFPLFFIFIFVLHAGLLRLPFFWDEAGYYVPAAHDLAQYHALIPHTTMDTGHPPLPAAYLALWFSLSGWKPAVGRIAQLLLAAFALTNVFLLAQRVSNSAIAWATTIATAAYPIFFVQSSLAHADMMAAAFTLWGIRLVIEQRIGLAQLAFALAALSKETAVITPLALGVWELLRRHREDEASRISRAAPFIIPAIPLAAWLLYHHHATGRFFGNAEFYQYNVTFALSPLRFVLALGLRLWQLLGIMNMLALTAAMALAMFFPPVSDASGERPRISINVQLQFAVIMLAHVFTFSLIGGAVLTRYMLPCYPLVILLGMSTLHRRIRNWQWAAAAIIALFIVALFVDPPYRIAPEDNLAYSRFVRLHAAAARFLEQHEQGDAILTAWPASDELTKPYLGYVKQPFSITPVRDFTAEEVLRARGMHGQYQVAYLFSTKYESQSWLRSALWERFNRRFFDYHRDLSPEAAALLLGGRVVYFARHGAEWVQIIEMEPSGAVANKSKGADWPRP
jgi:uncharacterized membrane protein